MVFRKRLTSLLLATLLVMSSAMISHAEEQVKQSADPAIEQKALNLLADMSDYLASAKTMTFTVESMAEKQINDQTLHFLSRSEVTVKRPNGLKILTKSDYKPLSVYYDGKSLTAYSSKDNMYATIAAPATLDELFPFAEERAGIMANFYDILTSDPFAYLTDDLKHAFSAGQSTIDGILCDHLAFKGEDLAFEVWIATGEKALPHLMSMTYLKVPGQPTFILHFLNWKLNGAVAKDAFAFVKPAKAVQIEFKPVASSDQTAEGDKK